MRSEIEQKRSALSYDIEAIEDRVRPSRVARRRTDSIRSKFHGVREAVMGGVEGTTGSARSLADSASDVPHEVTRAARGNPLAAGVVAFGLGMLVAAVLPETPTEQELAQSMKPQVDRAKESLTATLRDDASEIVENVRPGVESKLDELQSSAKDSAQRVQETARQ